MTRNPSNGLTKQPKKYAGQGPPDAAFYATTFTKDVFSRKELVRGLHIDNHVARQIDDFIDDKLREESTHLDPDTSRPMRYFEFDHGKSTQFEFDPIYKACVAEFECFRTSWIQSNDIPWCWQTTALRLWVRTNRKDMADTPKLQDAFGGYTRRYSEAKEGREGGPTKRVKYSGRSRKLVSQGLEVVLYQQVEGRKESANARNARIRIQVHPSNSKITVRPVDLLRAPTLEESPASGMADIRYLDNGDINPNALELSKLLNKCKVLDTDEVGGSVAYFSDDEPIIIENDEQLCEAISQLHEDHQKETLLPLMFVAGLYS